MSKETNYKQFTESEFEAVSKYLVGISVRPYANILVPQSAGPARVQAREELYMQVIKFNLPL